MSGNTPETPIPAPQQQAPAESSAPARLRIDLLNLDGDTQVRAAINEAVVQEYAERIQAGDKFPAVVVFFDGQHHWLGDGFHRVFAHQSAGQEDIEADIRPGSRADAVWFACSANRTHGLRRSNADKRRAATMALASPQAQGMSDRQLAEHCGVGHVFVGMVRKELAGVHGEHLEGGIRTGRDGKQYALNSGKRAAAGRASAQKRVAQKAQNGDTTMPLPGSQNAPDQIEIAQAPQPPPGPPEPPSSAPLPLALSLFGPPPLGETATPCSRRRRKMPLRRVLAAFLMLSPEERRAFRRQEKWHREKARAQSQQEPGDDDHGA
jgi:hypothetical protein